MNTSVWAIQLSQVTDEAAPGNLPSHCEVQAVQLFLMSYANKPLTHAHAYPSNVNICERVRVQPKSVSHSIHVITSIASSVIVATNRRFVVVLKPFKNSITRQCSRKTCMFIPLTPTQYRLCQSGLYRACLKSYGPTICYFEKKCIYYMTQIL